MSVWGPAGQAPWANGQGAGPFMQAQTPAPSDAQLDLTKVRVVGFGVLAAIALYLVVATVVYCMDIKALKPACLCLPDICEGKGCFCYRVLFFPIILLYNAIGRFWGQCCCVYWHWCCFLQCCRGCCWGEFTDPDFPPEYKSIGVLKGDRASGIIYMGSVEWKRASEIGGRSAQLFEGEIEVDDVQQGSLGDCWLIAALACAAQRPEIVQRALRSASLDRRGKYTVRLWNQIREKEGTEWVDITVDDFIPVAPGTLHPKFAKTNNNEAWVMLLEKAFAKMYGSYSALEGGVMSWALSALTGNTAIHFDRQKAGGTWRVATHGFYTNEEFSDLEFFDLLRRTRRNGAFICCAGILNRNSQGLVDGHAYSVLQLRTVRKEATSTDYFRMVEIRNPHGGGEWKGNWSDGSAQWKVYPRVYQKLCGGDAQREDGSFWMQWGDFVQFWRGVQVVDCETNLGTLPMPIFDDTDRCGPLKACCVGCAGFWCCCSGAKRLLFGRAGAQEVEELKAGMDRKCGYDQEGFFCECCERRAVESDSSSSSGSDSGSEHRWRR